MVTSPDRADVYAVSILFVALSLVAVTLRFKARHIRALPWKADDWLILLTMLLLWGLASILIFGAAKNSIGAHTILNPVTGLEEIQPEDLLVDKPITIVALGTLKSGLLMFYRRIFLRDRFRAISLALLIIIAAWTIAFFFATLFQCDGGPYDLMWRSPMTFKLDCGKYRYIQLSHCITDVVGDLVVLSLPLPEIWWLQMSTREKINLSAIFLVGALSTAAGIARLAINIDDVFSPKVGARDVRGTLTNALIWTFIEVGVGTIAACLPTLGPLVGNWNFRNLLRNERTKSGYDVPLNRNSENLPSRYDQSTGVTSVNAVWTGKANN